MMGKPIMTDAVEVAAAYLFYPATTRLWMETSGQPSLPALSSWSAIDSLPARNSPLTLGKPSCLMSPQADLTRDQTTARLRELIP